MEDVNMIHSKCFWMICIFLFCVFGILKPQSNFLENPGFELWEDDSKLNFWEKESGCELVRDTTIK